MRLKNLFTAGLTVLLSFILLSFGINDAKAYNYAHWSKNKMPLKVYIERNTNSTYAVDVAKAFSKWQTASRGLVNFVIVNNKNQADIQVSWVNKMKKEDSAGQASGHSYVWGVTKLGYPTKIILATKHPLNDSQKLSDNTIYMISLHEIGHSLGLWWHTKDPQDIMYPNFVVPSTTSNGSRMITNQNTGNLTSRDLQNLVALYNKNNVCFLDKLSRGENIQLTSYNNSGKGVVETTGAAAASVSTKSTKLNLNLGDALNYLKQNPNSSEAYNNIGLIYMENKDYDNALKSFVKAAYINPNCADIHLNTAIALTNVKQFPLAIKEYQTYLKLAPNASNAEDVKKQITALEKEL